MGLISPITLLPESQTQLKYVTKQFSGKECRPAGLFVFNYDDSCRTTKTYTVTIPKTSRTFKVEQNQLRTSYNYKCVNTTIQYNKFNVTNVK